MGQPTGKKVYYLESPVTGWAQMPYNTKEVLTESGEWESPITGWIKVICIGGGQAGGSSRVSSGGLIAFYRGYPGASTSFGGIVARPGLTPSSDYSTGGAAGEVVVGYVAVNRGDIIDYIVGSGGIGLVGVWDGIEDDYYLGFPGTLTTLSMLTTSPSTFAGVGGIGASNGTLFGGGGGASSHLSTTSTNTNLLSISPGSGGGAPGGAKKASTTTPINVLGGNGGSGAIILEYADPKKKA